MIRRAVPEDAPAIYELMLASFGPFRSQYTEGCFDATVLDSDRIAARIDEGPVWLSDDDGLVGTVGAKVDDRGLYVRGMAVHPRARRQGVGRQLLQEVQGYALEAALPAMWLSTTTFLIASQQLYRDFGFTEAPGPADLFGTLLISFEKRLN